MTKFIKEIVLKISGYQYVFIYIFAFQYKKENINH
jgi:hypothetical protein